MHSPFPPPLSFPPSPLPSHPPPPSPPDWFENGKRAMMEATQRKTKSTPEQLAKAKQKIHELSTSSDTKGIRFTGSALHWIYFETKFVRRGQLLLSLLQRIVVDPHCAALKQAVCEPWFHETKRPVQVMSIGGGPGTDASGLVWFARNHMPKHTHQSSPVECCLVDYEKSWKRYTASLNDLFQPHVSTSFAPGNVCEPLFHDDNRCATKICTRKRDWQREGREKGRRRGRGERERRRGRETDRQRGGCERRPG